MAQSTLAPMPTIIRQNGFRIVINTDDHKPAHAHCIRGDAGLVIEIETLVIRRECGVVKEQDRQTARGIIVEHRDTLLAAWKEIHG